VTPKPSVMRLVAGAALATLIAFAALVVVPPPVAYAGPAPGKSHDFIYGSGPSSHPYIVYAPSGWTADKRMPLVVVLHGCQTTAYQQMEASLYDPLANKMGLSSSIRTPTPQKTRSLARSPAAGSFFFPRIPNAMKETAQ